MTKLVLEIPNQNDLDVLLPLLRRLRIRFSNLKVSTSKEGELEEALRIVRQGCDMSTYGDALQYQIETRQVNF
ncbi:MAG: hypothetical protein Q7T20_09635 [Saprospiraceae bacterium]|nr:hypothetical protein [Saprospiraceae bacterium]